MRDQGRHGACQSGIGAYAELRAGSSHASINSERSAVGSFGDPRSGLKVSRSPNDWCGQTVQSRATTWRAVHGVARAE
jgi:hypothetical protein